MASSSSDDMTLDDVAMLEFMNQNTPLRLRCGVRKFVVQPGTGELLSQPYASIIMKFVLYGYDLTVEGKEALKQRKLQARTRRASEEDDLAPLPLAVRRLDSQEAVAVTVGISALLPGLEIGLLSMREGERAIIQIPPGLGFRASLPYRIPNNAVAKDLVAYVVIKQAKPVDLLPCDVLRSFTTRSSGPTPQIDDQVTINLQQPHPTTMVKGARANVTVVIGDSDYDDALLSAPRGSVLSCFINGLEHTIMVTQITPSGRPQPFIRLQATGEGVLSPYEWSDPNVSIDVFSTSRHLRTTLSVSDRFSECDRWKQLGRKWIQIKPLKAVQVYRRAAAFLLADPPIVSDTASEAQARRELAVILNNIGRAYKTVDNVTAALDAVETSLRFDMGYGKAHFLLAQLYRQQQRYSAALSELELCAGCADATQAEVAAEKERVLAEQAAPAVSDASDTMGSAAASLD